MTGTEEAREVDRLAGIVAAVRELHSVTSKTFQGEPFNVCSCMVINCPTARLVNPEVAS